MDQANVRKKVMRYRRAPCEPYPHRHSLLSQVLGIKRETIQQLLVAQKEGLLEETLIVKE